MSSGKGAAARRTAEAIAARGVRPSRRPPGDPLLQRRYQELTRKHLSRPLDTLFAGYTGVHFHIAWMPPLPRHWPAQTLPTGCPECCRMAGSPRLPECRTCGPRRLARALSADRDGHRFTCGLGVRNYWTAIRVRTETVGMACLQALENSTARPPAGKPPGRAAHARLDRADARVMSRLEFARAARLLRFIVQHVQTASLSELRMADLTIARHTILALEKEEARLHETLKRFLPGTPRAFHRWWRGTRSEQVVHRLLERLELDHVKPVTLQQYARELGMNAAYLSDLFSHAVGVPFKSYLTELRLAKARELLSDPVKTPSEVAYAVGYTSENRFRAAFRKATGLSPKVWRETMQTSLA